MSVIFDTSVKSLSLSQSRKDRKEKPKNIITFAFAVYPSVGAVLHENMLSF